MGKKKAVKHKYLYQHLYTLRLGGWWALQWGWLLVWHAQVSDKWRDYLGIWAPGWTTLCLWPLDLHRWAFGAQRMYLAIYGTQSSKLLWENIWIHERCVGEVNVLKEIFDGLGEFNRHLAIFSVLVGDCPLLWKWWAFRLEEIVGLWHTSKNTCKGPGNEYFMLSQLLNSTIILWKQKFTVSSE